jgi:murein DD-endopeptidase MepM/ murein hydrolase activator NlpD
MCTAGIVAIALCGNLVGADGQQPAVPGEPVAAAPTQVAAEQTPSSEPSAPATTTPGPTTTPAPAAGPAPTHTTPPTQSTTTTPAQPFSVTRVPVPATAAPAQPARPKTPAARSQPADTVDPVPLRLGALAGPAGTTADELADCAPKAKPKAKAFTASRDEKTTGGDETCVMSDKVTEATATSRKRARDRDGNATDEDDPATLRNAGGVPTTANPSMSLALPGPVPVGVPNFFIDKFRIPPFLLPIYQAAGVEYGVRWEVLAAINEIETDYGRNLNISSAGALGWMQFMPETWKQYGTDANRDGRKDPFNPVDAIFAAARYLRAAGADQDLRRAIFAYNHADWYVESVLMRARLIGGLPSDHVASLNGLTQGHFPVYAKARYADDLAERAIQRRRNATKNVARPVESEPTRRGIDIFANAGAPVIAVQDGTITAVGRTKRLGRFVQLRDVYGNTYTYAQLKKVAQAIPVPKPNARQHSDPLVLPQALPANDAALKERLFANPGRRNAYLNGGRRQIAEAEATLAKGATLRSYITGFYGLDPSDVVLKRMIVGRRVIAGTILGRVGRTSTTVSPHLHFEIRPAGRGAPRIDPKPILDGWKLLESTALYRAQGRNALLDPRASRATIGQILLMSKETLARRVLANPRIELYACGRRDIAAGIIDRRVLATLEFLAASGLKPTVSSLHCGHSYFTTSGNVSEHSAGSAVDIAKVNGIPIAGHQGEGSITDITIRRLLTLQGTVKPHQIISLMRYEGAPNTLALGDHADHIHVGFRPEYREGAVTAGDIDAVLKPSQWIKLIGRLGEIDNPVVDAKPSKYAIPVPVARASAAHRGE